MNIRGETFEALIKMTNERDCHSSQFIKPTTKKKKLGQGKKVNARTKKSSSLS